MFTTISDGVVYNLNAGTGTMMFDFTGADKDKKTGIYDFTKGAELISLVFTIKSGNIGGETNVHLYLTDLGSFGTDYIENSAVKSEGVKADSKITSEQAPTVIPDPDATIPTQGNTDDTEAPTETETETE